MSSDLEEFIAYNESTPGYLQPIIVMQQSDGSSTLRDMNRNDLNRIPDEISSPGGWLFKKSSTGSTWARRYAVLRGAYMIYFKCVPLKWD